MYENAVNRDINNDIEYYYSYCYSNICMYSLSEVVNHSN